MAAKASSISAVLNGGSSSSSSTSTSSSSVATVTFDAAFFEAVNIQITEFNIDADIQVAASMAIGTYNKESIIRALAETIQKKVSAEELPKTVASILCYAALFSTFGTSVDKVVRNIPTELQVKWNMVKEYISPMNRSMTRAQKLKALTLSRAAGIVPRIPMAVAFARGTAAGSQFSLPGWNAESWAEYGHLCRPQLAAYWGKAAEGQTKAVAYMVAGAWSRIFKPKDYKYSTEDRDSTLLRSNNATKQQLDQDVSKDQTVTEALDVLMAAYTPAFTYANPDEMAIVGFMAVQNNWKSGDDVTGLNE